MKAIICTQCGAAIENVSDFATIVNCEYCGARMMISDDDRKRPAPPPLTLPKVNQDFSSLESGEQKTTSPLWIVGAVGILVMLLPLFLVIRSANKRPEPAKLSGSGPAAWPKTEPTVLPIWNTPTTPDEPTVHFTTKVQWTGPSDMEHFEEPALELASFGEMKSEEIKKTITKNRQVQVRVTINTDGQVEKAEALSGHPILKESCVTAAKGSLFSSRSKPTVRVLTYFFRVTSE